MKYLLNEKNQANKTINHTTQQKQPSKIINKKEISTSNEAAIQSKPSILEIPAEADECQRRSANNL